jgi:predicted metal-dependent enzyme (double-stranded beta helix superfamily)
MSYSLHEFCAEAHATLAVSDDHNGRETIRQKLELLLQDAAFRSTYIAPEDDSGVTQIYQDPELKFCVLTYNMVQPRTSPPHDHGNSWAVYGQASGHTDMTLWSAVDGNDDEHSRIEPVKKFRLEPGQAGLFDVHEIHSIQYTEGAKFVRVTGVDMAEEARRVYDPETGTVRVIEHVGTGSAKPNGNKQ